MEQPIEEQKTIQARNLITELFQHGINRGAYSSVEVQAFNHAMSIISNPVKTMIPEQEDEVQKKPI